MGMMERNSRAYTQSTHRFYIIAHIISVIGHTLYRAYIVLPKDALTRLLKNTY